MRVKDLWMRRTAFERVFYSKLPAEQAALLAPIGEILDDAYTDYKITRERRWKELGLHEKDDQKSTSREERVKHFNDEMAEIAEEEIPNGLKPVHVSQVPDLQVSPVDLVAMKYLGVLDG